MKKVVLACFIALGAMGCATSTPSVSNGSTQGYSSPEAKAKDLTSRMKTVLGLDKIQEDKVLNINIVNEKLLQRLKLDQQSALQATKENYHKELKGVLSPSQFEKFKSAFPNL